MTPAGEGVDGSEGAERLGPGTLVNGIYRLIRCMGTGGMGEVWEAQHERTKGRVALKLLLAEMGKHREVLLRFQREVEVTSALNHPNIVRISDANNLADGRPFLVMELLEGHDLSTVRGPLPLAEVCDIIEQTARGLHAAHTRAIVHRDLKPANIFIVPLPGTRHRLIKILDFGISKALNGINILTQTYTVMGTPNYMAPEQATAGISALDARADQFSLAAIAYELITGKMAFEGDGLLNVLYKVVNGEPASFASLGLEVPPAIEAAVLRGLSKVPRDRFDSVLEFGAALKRAANPRASDSSPAMAATTTGPARGVPGAAFSATTTPVDPARPPRARAARLVTAVRDSGALQVGRLVRASRTLRRAPIGRVASQARTGFLGAVRSAGRRADRRLGSVVLGLLAIGVGSGIYLWSTHRPGELVIRTVPDDATVRIDGVDVTERSPDAAKPLLGSHTLSVRRAGYDPFEELVDVRSGKVVRLEVTLEAAADTGLEIHSEPSGQRVWLDGIPMPGAGGQARTDVRAYRIPPGNHRLEIRGDGHYAPWQRDVTVAPGIIAQVSAELVPVDPDGGGRTTAAEDPAGPASPPPVGDDRPERPAAGEARLGRLAQAPSTGGPDRAPPTSAEVASRVEVDRAPKSGDAAASCPVAVGTRPWSEVWIDGRNTGGHTPFVRSIACGHHLLTFKRPDLGLVRDQSVDLVGGEIFRQSWPLGPAPAGPQVAGLPGSRPSGGRGAPPGVTAGAETGRGGLTVAVDRGGPGHPVRASGPAGAAHPPRVRTPTPTSTPR